MVGRHQSAEPCAPTCLRDRGTKVAPGCRVLASSNKRDVVYATRGRAAIPSAGGLWPHQSVANEPGDWWWNPLSHRPITTSVQGQRPARPVEPVGVVVDADEALA